jgi:ceramide glucosyltransferase
MVIRKEVLERIGGLQPLGRQIVDDIPLARGVRKQGYDVYLLKQPARIRHERDTFAHWWSHWQRWQVIIRQYWPVKSLVMNVLDLALWWALFYLLIALVRGQGVATGVLLLAATAITSLLSTAIINRNFARARGLWRFWWTVLLRDLCRLPLLVQSYRTREFVWRGERFRVSQGGNATVLESTEDSLIQPL